MAADDRQLERRARRAAVVAGAVIALACHFLPPDYQAACLAVVKAAALTCGG